MNASVKKIDLQFISPGQTSRGTLYSKPSWIITLSDGDYEGTGECSVIPGLSPEYVAGYEEKVTQIVDAVNNGTPPVMSSLAHLPSVIFGLETAFADLKHKQQGVLFPSPFTEGMKGIPINGLIWMGSIEQMKCRISEKIEEGFGVLKLKIGALQFEEEVALLTAIRKEFPPSDLEIRLDANGAFQPNAALEKLKTLSDFTIHSIEQPIKPGQLNEMAAVCREAPIAIALDEELIGVNDPDEKARVMDIIQPDYIILKPSLIGGFQSAQEWIQLADQSGTGWWATSALESNIGLNAIAQWVFTMQPSMVQGLGTGKVFSNNISSPLYLKGPVLWYDPNMIWGDEFNAD